MIEHPQTAVHIAAGQVAVVDQFGNLVIELGARA